MMTHQEITNNEDILDTRDLLERIDYLEGTEDEEEQEELSVLQALIEEVRQYSGEAPEDGATLIRDTYFEEYAMQLAEENGAISPHLEWPLTHIDWESAAQELQNDYSSVDFDGVTYWVRS
jgi:hypothetical protein